MKLIDAIEAGIPLAISVDDIDLYMAEAFITPDGLVWLEPGWQYPGWHPAHKLPGTFTSDGDTSWNNGKWTVYQTAPGLSTWQQREIWEEYRQTKAGKVDATRDKAREYAAQFFEMDERDLLP